MVVDAKDAIMLAMKDPDKLKEVTFSNPVLEAMRNQEQNNPNHYASVLGHTVDAIKNMREHRDSKLATLFTLYHDCGKPAVATINYKTGYDMYPKHEGTSAEILKKELKEMGFGRAAIEYTAAVVNAHGFSMFMTLDEKEVNPYRLLVNHDNIQRRIEEYGLSKEQMYDVLDLCRHDVLAQAPVADMGYMKLLREDKLEIIDVIESCIFKEDFKYVEHDYNRLEAEKDVKEFVTKEVLTQRIENENSKGNFAKADCYFKILESYDNSEITPLTTASKAYCRLAAEQLENVSAKKLDNVKIDDVKIAADLLDLGYSEDKVKTVYTKNSPNVNRDIIHMPAVGAGLADTHSKTNIASPVQTVQTKENAESILTPKDVIDRANKLRTSRVIVRKSLRPQLEVASSKDIKGNEAKSSKERDNFTR